MRNTARSAVRQERPRPVGRQDAPGVTTSLDVSPRRILLTCFLDAVGLCDRGGTGRRAGLRILWGNPWGFESLRSHRLALQIVQGARYPAPSGLGSFLRNFADVGDEPQRGLDDPLIGGEITLLGCLCCLVVTSKELAEQRRRTFLLVRSLQLKCPLAREREPCTLSGVLAGTACRRGQHRVPQRFLTNANLHLIGDTANLMEVPLHPRRVDPAGDWFHASNLLSVGEVTRGLLRHWEIPRAPAEASYSSALNWPCKHFGAPGVERPETELASALGEGPGPPRGDGIEDTLVEGHPGLASPVRVHDVKLVVAS